MLYGIIQVLDTFAPVIFELLFWNVNELSNIDQQILDEGVPSKLASYAWTGNLTGGKDIQSLKSLMEEELVNLEGIVRPRPNI